MSQDVDAIYEQGVFRPLEPILIPDGTRVHLRVAESADATGLPRSDMQGRAELDAFRQVMAELPVESPNDGFSGVDHDKVVYGKP